MLERRLGRRNESWGEVRKGGEAPLRENESWGEVRKGGIAPLRANGSFGRLHRLSAQPVLVGDHRRRADLVGEPGSAQPDRDVPPYRHRARPGAGASPLAALEDRRPRPVPGDRPHRHPVRGARDPADPGPLALLLRRSGMRITPMDIRQQQFTVKMFRGFDAHEVDTFLENLAGDYETLLKEN